MAKVLLGNTAGLPHPLFGPTCLESLPLSGLQQEIDVICHTFLLVQSRLHLLLNELLPFTLLITRSCETCSQEHQLLAQAERSC